MDIKEPHKLFSINAISKVMGCSDDRIRNNVTGKKITMDEDEIKQLDELLTTAKDQMLETIRFGL